MTPASHSTAFRVSPVAGILFLSVSLGPIIAAFGDVSKEAGGEMSPVQAGRRQVRPAGRFSTSCTQFRIERRGWFVVDAVGHVDLGEHLQRQLLRFPGGKPAHLAHGDRDVLRHRKMRPEIGQLEDHSHFGALRGERRSFIGRPRLTPIRSPSRWISRRSAPQAAQAGGLARARGADQRDLWPAAISKSMPFNTSICS